GIADSGPATGSADRSGTGSSADCASGSTPDSADLVTVTGSLASRVPTFSNVAAVPLPLAVGELRCTAVAAVSSEPPAPKNHSTTAITTKATPEISTQGRLRSLRRRASA